MNRTPAWMTALIAVVTLPAFLTPYLLSVLPGGEAGETSRTLVWIFPFYMFLSGWLAWKAYPQRSYVSWILLGVMALSTLATFSLTTLIN